MAERRKHVLKMGMDKPFHEKSAFGSVVVKFKDNDIPFAVLIDRLALTVVEKIIKDAQLMPSKKRLPASFEDHSFRHRFCS
jgi:hypothetical protein